MAKGDPGESGEINLPLTKDGDANTVRVDPKGLPSLTKFSRIQAMGNASLLEVEILTGRSHQIRVHFSHLHHPLIGDKKYAKKPWSEIFHRPALHAWKMKIPSFGNQPAMELMALIPEDIVGLVAKLGGKI